MVSEEAIKTAQQFMDSLQSGELSEDSATEILVIALDRHPEAKKILQALISQQLDSFASQVCEQNELAFLDAYLDQFRTLRATLQAKERELAESRLNHIDANERNIKAEDTAVHARQQAIADPGIREIAALSLERALLWHKAGLDSWSESDWFTAFAGEVGELGNVIKKLNRYRDGLPGNSRSEAELRSDAAKEIADCYLYMDLLAQRMSIDLLPAIIAKFNEVSERNNFPQRIRSLTPPPALTHKKACAKCGELSSTLGNGLCPTCDPDCKAPPSLTKEK